MTISTAPISDVPPWMRDGEKFGQCESFEKALPGGTVAHWSRQSIPYLASGRPTGQKSCLTLGRFLFRFLLRFCDLETRRGLHPFDRFEERFFLGLGK